MKQKDLMHWCDAMTKKKILNVLIIILLIQPTLFTISATHQRTLALDATNPLDEITPISSYDYGKKMGKNYFATYQFLNLFCSILRPKTDKHLIQQIQNHITILKKFSTDYLEELQGLSFSTKIPVERLLLLQSFLSYHFPNRRCTITAATSPATPNNQSYLTQNWDIFAFSPLVPLTRFFTYFPHINTDETGYRYVYLGIPVLYEIPLMNEQGLGFAGAGLTLTKNLSRDIDTGEGVPIYNLELMTMKNCSTGVEVVDLWRSTPRSANPSLLYPHLEWHGDLPSGFDQQFSVVEQENHAVTVKLEDENQSNDLLRHLIQKGVRITHFEEILPTFDEIFIRTVEGEKASDRYNQITNSTNNQ